MSESRWMLDMTAEPVIPAWTISHDCRTNGAELQRAIIRGFYSGRIEQDAEFTFEKVFTFKEHGEFFRGALTMAGLRYTGDFCDLLERYGTIKVTIKKTPMEEK